MSAGAHGRFAPAPRRQASGTVAVAPLERPPDVVVRPPGSKSITNRALLCAALAEGESVLEGALFADDTLAMMRAAVALGAELDTDEAGARIAVRGAGSHVASVPSRVDAGQSGTTSRFVLAALALGGAEHVVDGDRQLRARPLAPLADALRALGVRVTALGEPGHLPLAVRGPALGGAVAIAGNLSSQFVSGLLMAGPRMERGLEIELTSPLVSAPYVEMTRAVMAAFGVAGTGLRVAHADYVPTHYAIEPDASAASYFFAAAAITGGRVAVEGLGADSIQGDIAFAGILERMGARVERSPTQIVVSGAGELHGVDVDMSDISDTAQTLAAVAAFATGPTRVRGIGFIRAKETDRIAAIVTELTRAGVRADAHDDGFSVDPGEVRGARFETYDDHRMAMSLALLGLRVPGVEIADPGCVAKTYPGFFADLDRLRG
jgi:3-phosphoshikimate 1-carboxyvinyltransferase